MDNQPHPNPLQPLGVPFYTGRNLIDAMAYMEEVMQVFRKRKVFTSSQDPSQTNSQLQPYHQAVSQNPSQQVPLIDRAGIRQTVEVNYQNARISERAKRAQEISQICLKDAQNYALSKIGLSTNGSNQQQNVPQTQQNQQPIQQNQPTIEADKNSQEVSQNPSNGNSLDPQPSSTNYSLFSNQTQEKAILGYQNQPATSLFANQTLGNSSTLGYQNQGTPSSLFGNQTQGAPSLFSNQTSASTLGYQNQGTTSSLFGNQTSEKPSLFNNQTSGPSLGYQNQGSTSLFGNKSQQNTTSNLGYQTQEKPSLFGNQNSGTSSLFGNKSQEPTKLTSSEQSQGAKASEDTNQKPSIFGYQNQSVISTVQKPQENQNTVTGTVLSTIKEEKSESSGTVSQSIFNSTPQATGGLFGSVNTSSQPSGLFSGGLFGKKPPQNQTILGYQSSNTMISQPIQPAKPFTLGYQAPVSSEKTQEKKQQVKNNLQKDHPEKQQEERPAQQINLLNSQKELEPAKPKFFQPTSQIDPGETIFTQKPKPLGLFANTQPVVATKEPQQQKKNEIIFDTSQPVIPPKQPRKIGIAVNIFAQPPSAYPRKQPVLKGRIFYTSLPLTKQTNQKQTIRRNLFDNTKTLPKIKLPQAPQAQLAVTKIFAIVPKKPQQTKPNIFATTTQPPQQPSAGLFGTISSTNMFVKPITTPTNLFGAFNSANSGQNMFGSAQGATSLFGGQMGGASLFSKPEKPEKKDEDQDEEGSDVGEDESSNQQESKEESNQGEIKYQGYNQTEIIYKLDGFAPKLKIVSTDSLRQSVKLSIQKFPQSQTIYIIVRMSNKTPIYFGILTKDSSVGIFNESEGNFAMKLERLIQIDLANNNKKRLQSWRIQLTDTPNARGFFAKCQEIVKSLKEGQK